MVQASRRNPNQEQHASGFRAFCGVIVKSEEAQDISKMRIVAVGISCKYWPAVGLQDMTEKSSRNGQVFCYSDRNKHLTEFLQIATNPLQCRHQTV